MRQTDRKRCASVTSNCDLTILVVILLALEIKLYAERITSSMLTLIKLCEQQKRGNNISHERYVFH